MVTTAADPRGRPTVVELVPAAPRVFPSRRLDLDTEACSCYNDGELANRIIPVHGVDRGEYLAQVRGTPSRAALRALREGRAQRQALRPPRPRSPPRAW
ncbi:MAG: hypothetical protein R2711_03620 [Acidimicrobiales bacterium]